MDALEARTKKQDDLRIICDNFITMLLAQGLADNPSIVKTLNDAALNKGCNLRVIGYVRRAE